MNEPTDYQKRENDFLSKAAELNRRFAVYLENSVSGDLRDCFDIVLDHRAAGLHGFRLTFKGKCELPDDIKKEALEVFNECFKDYNVK